MWGRSTDSNTTTAFEQAFDLTLSLNCYSLRIGARILYTHGMTSITPLPQTRLEFPHDYFNLCKEAELSMAS